MALISEHDRRRNLRTNDSSDELPARWPATDRVCEGKKEQWWTSAMLVSPWRESTKLPYLASIMY